MRTTHTYVELSVSSAAFQEIKEKLEEADYEHLLDEDEMYMRIRMDGIALTEDDE